VQNFQILIVSAVKIHVNKLQTASASTGLRPQTSYWDSLCQLVLDFRCPGPSV